MVAERGGGIQETEWDVLDVLWDRQSATAREVADALEPTRDWAYSTVKTMLDRMVGKELVVARKVGSVWEYRPAMERTEARRSAWARFVDTVFRGSPAPALELLAKDTRLTRKQRDRLAKLLDDDDKGRR